jgi:hypothetical protein
LIDGRLALVNRPAAGGRWLSAVPIAPATAACHSKRENCKLQNANGKFKICILQFAMLLNATKNNAARQNPSSDTLAWHSWAS